MHLICSCWSLVFLFCFLFVLFWLELPFLIKRAFAWGCLLAAPPQWNALLKSMRPSRWSLSVKKPCKPFKCQIRNPFWTLSSSWPSCQQVHWPAVKSTESMPGNAVFLNFIPMPTSRSVRWVWSHRSIIERPLIPNIDEFPLQWGHFYAFFHVFVFTPKKQKHVILVKNLILLLEQSKLCN